MIVKQNILKKVARSLSLYIFSWVENNNNYNFSANGEKAFVENAIKYLNRNNAGEIVIFDIGANTGEYTAKLIEISNCIKGEAEIHIFEPAQSCFNILMEKFSKTSGLFLNKKAVSKINGTAEIFYDKPLSGLASLYKRNLQAYSISMDHSEIVETIRLDSYIEKKGINHINLLKIDIEGHEMAAFEGLGSCLNGDFIDFVQFEYGGANLDSHTSLIDLYDLFERSGFKLAKVLPGGLELRLYKPWMDNFQYANYVAISNKVVGKIDD